jgi:hypothetical protein
MNHDAHFRIRSVQNKYKKNHFSNFVSGRKFRVTLAVLFAYTIVGAGIGWFLSTPNSDLANAGNSQNDNSLVVRISEESSENDNVSLKLYLQNINTDTEITDIISDFYTSENNIDWQSLQTLNGSSVNLFNNKSFINLNPLTSNESVQFLVKGKIKNKQTKNITVMTHIKYVKNSNSYEQSSNKVFFSFE